MSKKSPAAPKRRQALGRGLNSLIPARKTTTASEGMQSREIRADLIDPNPDQPRRQFRDHALEELAQSIRTDGIIQPLVIRQSGERYILIVGERRLRAAKMAGLQSVPAIVRTIDETRNLEIALVENIQREDLNALEVALALDRMHEELGLSHEEIANRTGKSRTSVTNLLRLLRLPPPIQELVASRKLSAGHVRPLVSVEDEETQIRLAEKAAAEDLNVRQVEKLVQTLPKPGEAADAEKKSVDPNVEAAIEELERALGTKVRIVAKRRGGRLEIEFASDDELDRIYNQILGH